MAPEACVTPAARSRGGEPVSAAGAPPSPRRPEEEEEEEPGLENLPRWKVVFSVVFSYTIIGVGMLIQRSDVIESERKKADHARVEQADRTLVAALAQLPQGRHNAALLNHSCAPELLAYVHSPPSTAPLGAPLGAAPDDGSGARAVIGAGFVATGEITACLRLRGVERRVPAAFISETEVRFLAPPFDEPGDATVSISLNGHEYEQATELRFQYTAPACSVQ